MDFYSGPWLTHKTIVYDHLHNTDVSIAYGSDILPGYMLN